MSTEIFKKKNLIAIGFSAFFHFWVGFLEPQHFVSKSQCFTFPTQSWHFYSFHSFTIFLLINIFPLFFLVQQKLFQKHILICHFFSLICPEGYKCNQILRDKRSNQILIIPKRLLDWGLATKASFFGNA